MLNYGNLTSKRKKKEREKNNKRRRKTFPRHRQSLIGRKTPGISKSNQNNKKLRLKDRCYQHNGRKKKITKRKWRGRSSC